MLLLSGRWVLPIEEGAIEHGAIAIEGGTIRGVGRPEELRKRFDAVEVEEAGDCALLPGLVNAHTHLELSSLRGRAPCGSGFTDWIDRLLALRPEWAESAATITAQGCAESLAAGVTTVGDICSVWDQPRPQPPQPIRRTCFFEVMDVRHQLQEAQDRLRGCLARFKSDHFNHIGLSPHALYSTSQAFYEMAARLAAEQDLALTTHLAETQAEQHYVEHGTGEWAQFFAARNIPAVGSRNTHRRPLAEFLGFNLAKRPVLLAHMNYINDQELLALQGSAHHVVYCPRSAAFFGHQEHRFAEMLARRINVCLGTDSLASNTTLSILDEMRFLHRQRPDVDVRTLWQMGTINGASALGHAQTVGSLKPGKYADIIAVPLKSVGPLKDERAVMTALLESQADPAWTMVQGKRVTITPHGQNTIPTTGQ